MKGRLCVPKTLVKTCVIAPLDVGAVKSAGSEMIDEEGARRSCLRPLAAAFGHKGPQSIDRFRPYLAAAAQALDQLAVAHGNLAEIAFAHASAAQEGFDFGQKFGVFDFAHAAHCIRNRGYVKRSLLRTCKNVRYFG